MKRTVKTSAQLTYSIFNAAWVHPKSEISNSEIPCNITVELAEETGFSTLEVWTALKAINPKVYYNPLADVFVITYTDQVKVIKYLAKFNNKTA